MELRDLAYFRQVASTGHIGRAAGSLGLTQPALSKSIARLERELRARLLERTPKGVKLTAFGEQLLKHATRLDVTMHDVKRELEDLGSGAAGHLRIGTGLTMAQHLLPLACTRLIARFPRVTLDIAPGTGNTLLPALRDGQLDIVLSGIPAESEPDLLQEVVMEDHATVIARRGHPLHSRRNPDLEQVLKQQWALPRSGTLIANWFLQRCRELGLAPPMPTVETDSISTLLSMVADSDLLTFHSWSNIRYSPQRKILRPLNLPQLDWRRQIGAMYRRDGYLPVAAKRLIGILKEIGTEDAVISSRQ